MVAILRAPGVGRAGIHPRGVHLACLIFTEDLFATGHDAANRAAVRAVPREELRLVGLAVHGDRRAVDKALKGLTLHG